MKLLDKPALSPAPAATAATPAPEPALVDDKLREINPTKGLFARKKQEFILWKDKRELENRLKILAKAVYGHEAAGLPKGHDLYVRLDEAINDRVDMFCRKHNVPRDILETQIPVITKAREMAAPPEPIQTVKKGIGIWMLACLILLGLGFAIGIGNAGYHLGSEWFLRLFHWLHMLKA